MKTKSLFTAIFLILFSCLAKADIQVGTGAETGKGLPIEPNYGYSYSQVIYLASEIGASGTITELKWHFDGTSLSNSNDWTIYIGTTTKSSFSSVSDWIDVSTLTQVYSGTFPDPGASGWVTFDITDWYYNGTDNIVVAVDENASGNDGLNDDFLATVVSDNRALVYMNNSTNPDPSSPPDATHLESYIADIIFGGISVSCNMPTNQQSYNLTSNGATLDWIDDNGSHWDIYICLSGQPAPNQNTTPTINDLDYIKYTWTDGIPNTTYDWYVRSDCNQDNLNTSLWAGPDTFTTLPGPDIYPLEEDFENNFTYFDNAPGNTTDFVIGNYIVHSGIRCAHDEYGSNDEDILEETGILDLSSSNYPVLQFWHIAKTEGGADKCYVEVSTDAGSTYSVLPGSMYMGVSSGYKTHGYFDEDSYSEWGNGGETPNNGWWKKETFDLSDFATNNVRIRFRLTSDANNERAGWYIDDIDVKELTCSAPTNLSESNITTTGADLDWDYDVVSTWDLYIVPHGTTPPNAGTIPTVDGVTEVPYTWTGGNDNTEYDWYVRSDCYEDNGSSASNWVGPGTFTTKCGSSTNIPYFEDFDSETTFPNCMTVENTNGDSREWGIATSVYNSAPRSASIGYNGTQSMNDWFFTRGIELTGGVTYQVDFVYRGKYNTKLEKLAVDWGTDQVSTAMSGNPIFINETITNTEWEIGSGTFTPEFSGTYYVGFHGYSDANMGFLYVDDIQVARYKTSEEWDGEGDNDWSNRNNWPYGVPTSSTNVIIPYGKSHYPTLTKTGYVHNLIVSSTPSGDGSIIGSKYLMSDGSKTVQRYVSKGKWHDIGVSAENQTLNTFYFDHDPDVWLTHYNENDDSRTYLTDLNMAINPGEGHEIWVDESYPESGVVVNMTGPFVDDDVTLSLSFTDASHGYNLIANPFTSALDLNSGSWSFTNVDRQFWVWDPNVDNSNGGTYKDWNSNTGAGSLNTGIIPMGQGFFVHTNGSNPSITIPVDAAVHSTQGYYKGNGKELDKITLKTTGGDELNIVFIEGATEGYDKYDTRKLFSMYDDVPQIYSSIENVNLSLNSLPAISDGEERIITVGYKPGSEGVKTITAEINLPENFDVYLEDSELNIFQDLRKEPQYTFETTGLEYPGRFKLLVGRNTTGVTDNSKGNDINVFASDKKIYVKSKGDFENVPKKLEVYDLTGRKLFEKILEPGNFNVISLNSSDAYLIVRIVTRNSVKTFKVYYGK